MSAVQCCSSAAATLLHSAAAPRRRGRDANGLGGSGSSSAVGAASGARSGVVVTGRKILGGDAGGVAAMPQVGGGVRRRGYGRQDGDGDGDGDVCSRCVAAEIHGDGDGDGGDAGLGMNGHAEKEEMGSSEKKLLTLPTILTLSRVAAVPALLAVFYSQETWATTAGATIFVVAALTDWLDGYLARKMGSSSEFGAFLDPVADKLMVATTLVLLCTRPPIAALAKVGPWLLPLPAIAIIGREITMSALREWAASQGGDVHKAVAVNSLGKWKTAAQMVALTLLLAGRDGGGGIALGAAGVSLLYISAGLALWSLAVYIRSMWKRLAK